MATGSIVAESPGASGGTMNVGGFPAHIVWTKPEPESFAYVRSPPLPPPSGEQNNSASSTFEQNRVFRLERNLRYLKSEHRTMLSKLYEEIEVLRRRNKELQYELIVGTPLSNFIEDKEDAFADQADVLTLSTPPSVRENSTQTSVDHTWAADQRGRRLTFMEGELKTLRVALDDAETRNTSLSTLISQLKKSHMKMKSRSASLSHEMSVIASRELEIPAVSSPSPNKFQEYEELVRRLQRENTEQRQELSQVRACLNSYRTAAAARQREHSMTSRDSLPRIHLPKSPPPRHNQARNKTTIELPYIVQPAVTTSSRRYESSAYADTPSRSNRDRSLRHYDQTSLGQMHRRSPTPQQHPNQSDLLKRTDRRRKSRERTGDHKSSNR